MRVILGGGRSYGAVPLNVTWGREEVSKSVTGHLLEIFRAVLFCVLPVFTRQNLT